ncbi:MAG: hypothetical protein CK532_04205 [Flavobacteriales bacterium]|nr:MAG: hypothetical protein CK532_04205 [Flavobacteriales bacterium]
MLKFSKLLSGQEKYIQSRFTHTSLFLICFPIITYCLNYPNKNGDEASLIAVNYSQYSAPKKLIFVIFAILLGV